LSSKTEIFELLTVLNAQPKQGAEGVQIPPELSKVGWELACFAVGHEFEYVQGLASNGRVDQAMGRLTTDTMPLLAIMAKMGEAPHVPSQFPSRDAL